MCPSVPLLSSKIPGHAGCTPPSEKAKYGQDMDGPVKCSSLTLEREEYLQLKAAQVFEATSNTMLPTLVTKVP